ncbi:MAG TPA: helix-turn-helix domain-containing protein [Gaiellaceae bacterium]|nr:helix-turn-helix domain-containing protein [Gaiellaceae bacterium]
MASDHNTPRPYDATRRQAAAAERRQAIVVAARASFEQHGWAGTQIREIASAAGVSHKLVEASFGTKAALLQAAVDYAIRGDLEPTPMPQRERIRRMEEAEDAATMLRLHAHHLRLVNSRSARIAAVVEGAAPADPVVRSLWQEMNRNRKHAVTWATTTYRQKPGRRCGLRPKQIATTFWVALDWGTYRTLTDHAGLDDNAYETWIHNYYRALLL